MPKPKPLKPRDLLTPQQTVDQTRQAKTARRIWQVGDHVRVHNGSQYDGQLGEIFCVPGAKHFWWTYTVNLFDRSQEHDCVFCACDEMEPIALDRLAQLVAAGVFPDDQHFQRHEGNE